MRETTTSSPAEALREAILDALREIDSRVSGDAPTERDVHLARRAAKRARALARLAPHRLGALARQTRRHVGAARRLLGGARDAQVRRATLESLRPQLGDAHALLARMAAGDEDADLAFDKEKVRAGMAALIRDWTLCDAREDVEAVLAAATRAYRKGRKRAEGAKNGGTDELHQWRRAIVDLEYHAAFLARFAPSLRRLSEDADRLRRYLGDINDLDELAAYLKARADDSDDARAATRRLREASAERRAKLLQKARRLGDRLLARSPSRWTDEIRRSFAR